MLMLLPAGYTMRYAGLACLCCGLGLSTVVRAAVPQTRHAVAFAGVLMQKYSDHLPAGEIAAIDEIHRQLREEDQRFQKAREEAEKKTATDRIAALSDELVALLERSPAFKRVSLEGGQVTPSIRGPFDLPGDRGAVFFRVDSGPGEHSFVTYDIDQSQNDGEVWIDATPTGVTWAVVGFSSLPTGRTTYRVVFKRPGLPDVRTLMDLVTPLPGRLAVTILSDDTGQPVPAMVRLVHKPSDRDCRPSNAIDFAPQFDSQGHATGHRPANLLGPLGGKWWCVPGPFDMALPPGRYEIAIRRGVEHLLLTEPFTIETGKTTTRRYRPRRWVDMRRLGWYSGDDHVHARMLSDDDAARLMAWIRAEDVHVANIVKMGDILRTWFEQRGWGPQYRVSESDYVLCPGQECPRTHSQLGHTLALNTISMVRDTTRYYLYDHVADTVHAQGGLWGFAHVNSGIFEVHRGMSLHVPAGQADFAEVMQFHNFGETLYYQFLNLGCKLTAAAGSDVPWGGTVGEVRMYAYIGQRPFDADAWFEAVRGGRTFVTFGPMIEFRVDDALPGDEIVVEADRRLRVRARAWGSPELQPPARLEVVSQGEVVRSVTREKTAPPELTLEFEMDAGHGCWIAARCQAEDTSMAHTTPVYVIRKGLRFWKYSEVPALIAQRLESLQQIEHIVREAQARFEAGETIHNQELRELALQGPELMRRIDKARQTYADLRQTFEQEAMERQAAR